MSDATRPTIRDRILDERERRSTVRDWQPGDGILCRFTSKNPAGSCGMPVKTRVVSGTTRSGRPRTLLIPMCALHSGGDLHRGGASAEARKYATEKLIATHYQEWLDLMDEGREHVAKRGEGR